MTMLDDRQEMPLPNKNLVVLSSLILYPFLRRPCATCPHQAVPEKIDWQAITAVPLGVDSSCRVLVGT